MEQIYFGSYIRNASALIFGSHIINWTLTFGRANILKQLRSKICVLANFFYYKAVWDVEDIFQTTDLPPAIVPLTFHYQIYITTSLKPWAPLMHTLLYNTRTVLKQICAYQVWACLFTLYCQCMIWKHLCDPLIFFLHSYQSSKRIFNRGNTNMTLLVQIQFIYLHVTTGIHFKSCTPSYICLR